MENKKNNKTKRILKIVSNILYTLMFIIVLLVLLVVILQRVSNNELSLGGYRIFNIASGSMVPKYEVGDVLISKTIEADQIQKGDDIVYLGKEGSFYGKVVTHQVIDIKNEEGNYEFYTKGIANEERDPVVYQDQVYGKVIYKVQTLSFISKMINNMYVFYFIILIPIAIIIIRQVRNIINNAKEDDENEEEKETIKEKITEEKQEQKIEKEEIKEKVKAEEKIQETVKKKSKKKT